MPRYVYRCDSCNEHFQVRHGMQERQKECTLCNKTGFLTRVPQMPNINKNEQVNKKVGNLTKESIEENKKLLSEMKKEARSQEYDI